jgi:hypothetical protein
MSQVQTPEAPKKTPKKPKKQKLKTIERIIYSAVPSMPHSFSQRYPAGQSATTLIGVIYCFLVVYT